MAPLIAILILCFVGMAEAKRKHHEKHYQQIWCDEAKGTTEYVLPDKTRVDCLLEDYAIEFDFANKWAEAIGQAVYYGLATGRNPGIALIMENPDKDFKYLKRLLVAIQGIDGIGVWIIE